MLEGFLFNHEETTFPEMPTRIMIFSKSQGKTWKKVWLELQRQNSTH
jgi:hypothetical protein